MSFQLKYINSTQSPLTAKVVSKSGKEFTLNMGSFAAYSQTIDDSEISYTLHVDNITQEFNVGSSMLYAIGIGGTAGNLTCLIVDASQWNK